MREPSVVKRIVQTMHTFKYNGLKNMHSRSLLCSALNRYALLRKIAHQTNYSSQQPRRASKALFPSNLHGGYGDATRYQGTVGVIPLLGKSTTMRQCSTSTPSTAQTFSCSTCGRVSQLSEVVRSFRCPHCEALASVESIESWPCFVLFGLPTSYDLDEEKILATFRRLQMNLHPDKFAQKSATEQQHSADLSSFLNQALKTLTNPITRAVYLLQLQGIEALAESENSIESPELLMQVLESREALEQTTTVEEVEQFIQENKEEWQIIETDMRDLFEARQFEQVKDQLIKFKYIDKALEEAKQRKLALDVQRG